MCKNTKLTFIIKFRRKGDLVCLTSQSYLQIVDTHLIYMYSIGHPLTTGGIPYMIANIVSCREYIYTFVKANTAPLMGM